MTIFNKVLQTYPCNSCASVSVIFLMISVIELKNLLKDHEKMCVTYYMFIYKHIKNEKSHVYFIMCALVLSILSVYFCFYYRTIW